MPVGRLVLKSQTLAQELAPLVELGRLSLTASLLHLFHRIDLPEV